MCKDQLGWGRVRVGVDNKNSAPLPFIPSHQGRGEILEG